MFVYICFLLFFVLINKSIKPNLLYVYLFVLLIASLIFAQFYLLSEEIHHSIYKKLPLLLLFCIIPLVFIKL